MRVSVYNYFQDNVKNYPESDPRKCLANLQREERKKYIRKLLRRTYKQQMGRSERMRRADCERGERE